MDGEISTPQERTAEGEQVADVLRLDGNVLGGILSEVFVPDLTAARATCVNCGTTQTIGALLVYAHGMGMVVRCPNCDSIVMRIARTPRQLWLDMTGATSIATPAATQQA
jgi:hypothetical protein